MVGVVVVEIATVFCERKVFKLFVQNRTMETGVSSAKREVEVEVLEGSKVRRVVTPVRKFTVKFRGKRKVVEYIYGEVKVMVPPEWIGKYVEVTVRLLDDKEVNKRGRP